jgi:multidrug efflux pump subunit AcrA (membrane-fusion protein)
MSEETISDTATVDETISETTEAPEPVEGEEALGDPGKKALDALRKELRAAEKAAREARAEAEQVRREAELRDKPAEEQALEQARAEARAEAMTAANQRILRSELRAAAAGKLADPSDAALFLDLSQFEVGADGDVDSDALNDAIADLISRKPHLAAVKPNRFEGAADQGATRESKISQITRDQIQNMTAEQINQARREGRLSSVLGS